MQPTVAASFVSALRAFAVASGADAGELDRRSAIEPSALADPDARIPLDRYQALVRAGQQLSSDPALALHFGQSADLSELSIVGLMGQSSASFGAAFEALSRYSRLALDVELEEAAEGSRLLFKRSGGRLWLVDMRKNPNAFPELTESGFARMVTFAGRFGTLDLITEVHFTHQAPAYTAEYERIFPVPIVFGSRWNALCLRDQSWMEITPSMPSLYMSEMLRERGDALLESLELSTTTRTAVEKALIGALGVGEIGMGRIARQLGVSRPTLFRRLRDEGVTFRQILSELRARLAAEYLQSGGIGVSEASQRLGFSDQASFSRAFKRWTGQNPGQIARQRKRRERPD